MKFDFSTQEFGHVLLLLLYRMYKDGMLDDEVTETIDRTNLIPVLKRFFYDHKEFFPTLKQMLQRLEKPHAALLMHIMSFPDEFEEKAGPVRKVINRILKRESIICKDREFLQLLADADIIYEPKLPHKYLRKRI